MKSDQPFFLCYAHPSGKLDLDFQHAFKARVRELAGETGAECELYLLPAGQEKTRKQERGFHAMVAPWAAKRGDSIDELKQWLLAEIFGTHNFKVPGTDVVITVLAEPHTSALTRQPSAMAFT
jgi:ADP-ribose pyrophosphatase YjhB (NUDIX family)